MRNSKVFKTKRTINRNFTRKITNLGAKSFKFKSIEPKRKGTTSLSNFKKLDSSLDVLMMRKQNTEKLLKDPEEESNKKINPSRVSLSNYSILSIQKEKSQLDNKLNNLIAKSPTLDRHRRKSSFVSRLPETLKKVMNLTVNNESVGQRRASFQSGMIQLSEKTEEGLSAIESEETSESHVLESRIKEDNS